MFENKILTNFKTMELLETTPVVRHECIQNLLCELRSHIRELTCIIQPKKIAECDHCGGLSWSKRALDKVFLLLLFKKEKYLSTNS